jgi:hypothetical protein
MNCQEVREKICDSLAAGNSAAADVLAHKESCTACQDFYVSQQRLFHSLDAGLHSIANAAVPPSLLPAVRSHIENAGPQRAWIYTWLPAGAAVVLLCAIALPLHRAERRTTSLRAVSSAQRGSAPVTEGGMRAAVHPNLPTEPRVRRVGGPGRTAWRSRSTSALMEVVVGKEEARGLTHLVSSIHREPALGQGYLRPVALPPDEMKPVPLLEIAELRMSTLADQQW